MQEHQSPSTVSTQQVPAASSVPPQQKPKTEKNLYEPYMMPYWLWMTLTVIVRALFPLLLNVKRVGEKNVPRQGPFIIAANHLAWTDIPLIPAYLSLQMIYIAKEELFVGKMGWLVRFMGAIPVKRGEADRQLLRATDDLLKRHKILTIFPEGTRSKTRQMNSAHAGMGMIALRAGVPVIPVAIYGSENTLKKFRPRATIVYGEPMILQPKGKKVTKEDINQATEAVMRRIAEMLPESYRGVYSSETSAQNVTGDTPEVL